MSNIGSYLSTLEQPVKQKMNSLKALILFNLASSIPVAAGFSLNNEFEVAKTILMGLGLVLALIGMVVCVSNRFSGKWD